MAQSGSRLLFRDAPRSARAGSLGAFLAAVVGAVVGSEAFSASAHGFEHRSCEGELRTQADGEGNRRLIVFCRRGKELHIRADRVDVG